MQLGEFYLNNKKTIFTSFFLFMFMFSLFFYYKEHGFFQHDMVEYAMYAEYVVLNDYDLLYHSYFANLDTGAFPWRTGNMYLTVFFFWILHFFGIGSEFATFLVQFFFGSLSLVVLYLFLLELYSKNAPALLCALLFGMSAPLFNSVLSKEHGTEYFFAFASMYFLLLGLKQHKTWILYLSSTCLGVLLWMREATLFFPLFYFGFFLFYAKKEHWTSKTITALALPFSLLAAAALYMYLWMMITIASSASNASLFTYTSLIFSEIIVWYPPLFFLFFLLGLGYAVLRKENIILFFFFMVLLFLVLFTKNATFDLRHLGIYVFFPASVLICYGLSCLKNRKAEVLAYFLVGILCMQLFVPGIAVFEQRKEHVYSEEFTRGIASVVPSDGIIFVQKDFCLFVAYYAKRACSEMPQSMENFNIILDSGKRVFVFYEAGFGFYDDATKHAIEENYILSSVYSGKFETFHHADLKPQVYDEMLIEVREK